MSYSDIILYFLASIGAVFVALFMGCVMSEYVIPTIKSFMARKCKLRFLCKHYWVITSSFEGTYHFDYYVTCKYCGKKKRIDLWKPEKKEEE